MMQEQLKYRELKGIQTLPNEEADLLEKYLGITFQTKPAKIPLTLSNRFALLKKDPTLLKDISIFIKGRAIGKYVSSLHGFVYWPQDGEETLYIHENVHAYTHEQNPLLEKTSKDLEKNVFKFSEPTDPEVVERFLSAACLEEGLAQWCTVETIGKMDIEKELARGQLFDADDTETSIKEFHERVIWSQAESTDDAAKEPYIRNLQRNVQHAKDMYMKSVQSKTLEDLRYLKSRVMDFYHTMMDTQYALGHFFVYAVMNELKKSGMTTAEGLQYIISHPPTRLDTFSKPEWYLESFRSLASSTPQVAGALQS